MRFVKSFSVVLSLVLLCNMTIAQDAVCPKCPSQKSDVVSADASSDDKQCSQCPVTAAMKKLPQMTYKVGDESVCCSEAASALAKKHSQPMHYVVGEKTYESEKEAYTALVESTEAFVEKFVKPCKCEASGTTSIAGSSCGCPVEARQKAELIKKAVNEVKMTYVVGTEKCQCPSQAKTMASKSGDTTKYVVDGKETCCDLEARLNLAKAKYAAAIKALANAEKTAEAKAGSDS
jgi:hypothetical protein